MKIILLFVAVPVLAGFANLRRKGYYQHHRGVSHVKPQRSPSGQQSMERLQQPNGAQQPQMDLGDITGIQLIDKLLVGLSSPDKQAMDELTEMMKQRDLRQVVRLQLPLLKYLD